ncbi:DUF1707 domain-containing protein [uncultured Nocardioides sp.]|uniref:DUF1707 SHOCT-like domain-containing protein n=1 Tax=Nocardioides sp. TaxID=35761 RepID=UPI000C4C81A6|nr:hypothetical protein [Nocardioides sp.]MCK5929779.1 DUF1707 and DUF2154 domain-containing protein [Nocardioides sp.]
MEEEQARMRVSDADRHQVSEVLREAAGEGRLDWEELEQRLEAAYAARTYAELLPLTADLPSGATPVPVSAPQPPAREVSGVTGAKRAFAMWGAVERKGTWDLPDQMTVGVCMAGAHLDLRQARWPEGVPVISAYAVMGGVQIIVDPDTEVVMEGIGIMGGFAGPSGLVDAAPGTPARRVRVRGVAFWGAVAVERKHAIGPGGAAEDGVRREPD